MAASAAINPLMEIRQEISTSEPFDTMSGNMAFASAVAEFGLLLSDSLYKADAALDRIIDRAIANRGEDAFGYRAEFVQLAALKKLLAEQ